MKDRPYFKLVLEFHNGPVIIDRLIGDEEAPLQLQLALFHKLGVSVEENLQIFGRLDYCNMFKFAFYDKRKISKTSALNMTIGTFFEKICSGNSNPLPLDDYNNALLMKRKYQNDLKTEMQTSTEFFVQDFEEDLLTEGDIEYYFEVLKVTLF